MALPKFIALCGNPNAGKSTVQEILRERHQVYPVDDGFPLRDIAVRYLALSTQQVCTQAGKKEFVELLEKRWQVREILGEMGARFEAMFGEHIIPFMVTNTLVGNGPYSFGSVRKTQGHFYKKLGGIVIEVRRPDAGPSPYAFDWYDPAAVDYVIDNDGSMKELETAVDRLANSLKTRMAA
jgi:hypothetical protein